MKKILRQRLLSVFALLLLVACDKAFADSPENVLSKYLNASLNGKYEEAYNYLSEKDKSAKSLSSYLAEQQNDDDSGLGEVMRSSVSYKVLEAKKDQNKATVNVEITMPDMAVLMRDAMGMAFSSAFSGDENDVSKAIVKKYKTEKLPLIKKEQIFELVKENQGWKVSLDGQPAGTEVETKATGSTPESADNFLDSRDKSKATNREEKKAYVKNVELYDLEAKYYDSFLDKKVPGVDFKIRNKGGKTLSEIEVTVYFKNADGTVIAEEKYYPVHVSDYSFGSSNIPLKSNYIWQQERGKFYTAKNVPSEWKSGSASAKITNIEFLNEEDAGDELTETPEVETKVENHTKDKSAKTTSKDSKSEEPESFKSTLGNLMNQDSEPAAKEAPEMTSNEMDVIKQQLNQCWSVLAGARYAEDLVVNIQLYMNPDRTIQKAEIVDQFRYMNDSFFRAAADSVLRALYNPYCNPLDLPPSKYDTWKTMTITFDPQKVL